MPALGLDLIQDLPALATRFGLSAFMVRREDLNEIGIGGTKSRTMARALSAAAARKAQVLVIPARAGSNAVLAASRLAPKYGIIVVAVLRPQPWSVQAERNLALIHASGCQIEPVTLDVSLRQDQPFLTDLAQRLRRAGQTADFLSFGAATIEAGLAHCAAVTAMADRFRDETKACPDCIYVASASFDSGAGILAGLAAAGWHKTRLVLINVAQDVPPTKSQVRARATEILRRIGGSVQPAACQAHPFEVRHALAPGFGLIDPAMLCSAEWLNLPFALDPSYTAKSAAAAAADIEAGRTKRPLLWYGSPLTELAVDDAPARPGFPDLARLLLF